MRFIYRAMVSASNKKASAAGASLSTWKTLLCGGVLGFALAVAFLGLSSVVDVSNNGRSRSSRWLQDEVGGALGPSGTDALEYKYEYSFDGGESEEEEVDPVIMDTTVTLIVLLLIVLTIAFETIKEHIEESADRNMRPIIASLFGEMTVLGFLSIFTFCVTKLGVFQRLSTHLFGEAEEEALLETFEFVHYMLFFIMVFFVISVLTLVRGARKTEETWTMMDRAYRDREYLKVLDDLESRNENRNYFGQGGWLRYVAKSVLRRCRFWSNSKVNYRASLGLFRGLRSEFVLERSLLPPYAPNATNHVDDDFNYGRYLGICLGQELAHVVHVNHLTWVLFALLTLLFYSVVMALGNRLTTFAWFWAATGWLLVLMGSYFDYHIECLLHSLIVPPSSLSRAHRTGHENEALLSHSALPAWTRIDLEEYHGSRSIFAKCFGSGTGDGMINITQQDALYWMDRKGPKVHMIIVQVQLVFTSAYVSLLLLSFVEHMFEHCDLGVAIAYTIVSVLPIYILVSKYQESAANVAMASSFGTHRRPQAISQVIRDEKVGRIIRAMVVIHKLNAAAADGFSTTPSPAHSGGQSRHGTHSGGNSHHGTPATGGHVPSSYSPELEAVVKAFEALDPSGDGKIESHELASVFKAMGVHTPEGNMQAIVQELDKNGDGHIAEDEFLSFYTTHVLSSVALDHHGLHQLAHDLYHRFDRDGNGQITLGEFKDVMDAFNVGFTVNEVGQLVNELDEHGDGTVGEHEFVELLKKFSHLFEEHKLPPLA